MAIRSSNLEAVNRMLDKGQMGSELHAMIKGRQWSGAASLINGAPCNLSSISPHGCTAAAAAAALLFELRPWVLRRAIGAFQAVGPAAAALGGAQECTALHRGAPAGVLPGGLPDEGLVPASFGRIVRSQLA